jgi:hypothetical protein
LVLGLGLAGHAQEVTDEAKALLTAPRCPAGTTTVIQGSEQMALQIHESVGHAIELDRILGWEAAFAGTSWLDLAQLGSLRYGSELMNITVDPTVPAALGSFGYDDEGTPAAARDAVRDGIWVGVLAGRDSAAMAGLEYGGSVRADGWARLPMVRMTNVGLRPGQHSLDEMIAATDDGILMDLNRSWSIDDRRLNFQFGWEIKKGRLGRMIRNALHRHRPTVGVSVRLRLHDKGPDRVRLGHHHRPGRTAWPARLAPSPPGSAHLIRTRPGLVPPKRVRAAAAVDEHTAYAEPAVRHSGFASSWTRPAGCKRPATTGPPAPRSRSPTPPASSATPDSRRRVLSGAREQSAT